MVYETGYVFLDSANAATDALNTWRGVFEPSVKACKADAV